MIVGTRQMDRPGNTVRRRVMRGVLIVLVGVLLASSSCAQSETGSPWLRNGAVVAWDDNHSVQFFDADRREITKDSGVSAFFGETISFVYRVNDQVTTCGPKKARDWSGALSSQVVDIQFANSSSIWVFSRLGNRLNGAVLIDLESCSVTREIKGQRFALSPDRQHIAFTYPSYKQREDLVFVDDTMVFPVALAGFSKRGYLGPETPDGRRALDIAEVHLKRIVVDGKPQWDSDTEVSFVLARTNSTTDAGEAKPDPIGVIVRCRIQPGPKDQATSVVVESKALAGDDLGTASISLK